MSMYDKMIAILEKKGLGDDPLAKQLRKNKELDIINEGKSFAEINAERDMFEVGHRSKKIKKTLL